MSDEQVGADAPSVRTRIPALLGIDWTTRRTEFTEFYCSEVGRLVGFVVKLGATEHEAAEAAQAALTQAWFDWSSIHTNRRAWIRTVATRNFYRLVPNREFPFARLPERPALLSPDTVVETSERTKAAQELLARLPPTQRLVMAWTADGFSNAEIARAIGRSQASVRKNLQRARDTLKTRLAENQGGVE